MTWLFIGGGPAGYEGAIAAAKKGLKTAVVEMDLLGGTCLQRGCIPTKAILHSVKAVKQINDFAKIGVHVEKFQVSVDEIKRRKTRIVSKQTRGIELLFKQNNVQLIKGKAQVVAANTIRIDGQKEITARHIVIATGSRPAELPFLKWDGQQVVSSDELLKLRIRTRNHAGRRRRRRGPGMGPDLQLPGQQGHGGGDHGHHRAGHATGRSPTF